MDCDRILVNIIFLFLFEIFKIINCIFIKCLKDGKLEKFDSPSNLLNDATSLFYELASNVVIDKKIIKPKEDEKNC